MSAFFPVNGDSTGVSSFRVVLRSSSSYQHRRTFQVASPRKVYHWRIEARGLGCRLQERTGGEHQVWRGWLKASFTLKPIVFAGGIDSQSWKEFFGGKVLGFVEGGLGLERRTRLWSLKNSILASSRSEMAQRGCWRLRIWEGWEMMNESQYWTCMAQDNGESVLKPHVF